MEGATLRRFVSFIPLPLSHFHNHEWHHVFGIADTQTQLSRLAIHCSVGTYIGISSSMKTHVSPSHLIMKALLVLSQPCPRFYDFTCEWKQESDIISD